MDITKEKTADDLKAELLEKHTKLEEFTTKKLQMKPGELGKEITGRLMSFKTIMNDSRYFRNVKNYINQGFIKISDERGLPKDEQKTFAGMLEEMVSCFEQFQEQRQNEKNSKKSDPGVIAESKNSLLTKLGEFTEFVENKLKSTEKELYTLGNGEDLVKRTYSPANLQSVINHQARFIEGLDSVENGFKALHETVGFQKNEVNLMKNLMNDIKNLHKDYLKIQGKGANLRE